MTTRKDAIDRLTEDAIDLELSYTITSDALIIKLPIAEPQPLDIVGRIDVDIDDIKAPDSTGGD